MCSAAKAALPRRPPLAMRYRISLVESSYPQTCAFLVHRCLARNEWIKAVLAHQRNRYSVTVTRPIFGLYFTNCHPARQYASIEQESAPVCLLCAQRPAPAPRWPLRAGFADQGGISSARGPTLRHRPFGTAIIERYSRRESSVEEILVEEVSGRSFRALGQQGTAGDNRA